MTTPDPPAPEDAEYPHNFMGKPGMCTRCGEHEEGLTLEKYNCPPLMREKLGNIVVDAGQIMALGQSLRIEVPKRHLHVVFLNGSNRWYELDEGGWKLNEAARTLVIGKGLGRKHIPLDNVEYYSPV